MDRGLCPQIFIPLCSVYLAGRLFLLTLHITSGVLLSIPATYSFRNLKYSFWTAQKFYRNSLRLLCPKIPVLILPVLISILTKISFPQYVSTLTRNFWLWKKITYIYLKFCYKNGIFSFHLFYNKHIAEWKILLSEIFPAQHGERSNTVSFIL